VNSQASCWAAPASPTDCHAAGGVQAGFGGNDAVVFWLGMEAESQSCASWESAACRSFAVEAVVGNCVSGWPFGRFDVSPCELRVRLAALGPLPGDHQ
jgi:hypothetical protein